MELYHTIQMKKQMNAHFLSLLVGASEQSVVGAISSYDLGQFLFSRFFSPMISSIILTIHNVFYFF